MKIFKKVIVSMAVAAASTSAFSANSYKVVDLGNLGSNPTYAYAVNNQDQAVGYSAGEIVDSSRAFSFHAYLYSNESGEMQDLGAIESDIALYNISVAFSINEAGTVAGYSWKTDRELNESGEEEVVSAYETAVYFDANGINQLPPLEPDDKQDMRALDINNAETYVVGFGDYNPPGDVDADGNPVDSYYARGFLHNIIDGTNTLISPLTNEADFGTSLRDINDNGIAVGWGVERTETSIFVRGIYIDVNNPSETFKLDLFDGRDANSYPRAINDQNQVVGKIFNSELRAEVAFVHDLNTNESKELGSLIESIPSSEATDINNNGIIVGFARSSSSANLNHAFIYENDELIDLNNKIDCRLDPNSEQIEPADWLLSEARAINDNGVIVGNGVFNGEQKAFMLIPDDAEPTLCKSLVEEDNGGGSLPWYLLGLIAAAAGVRRRV